MSKTPEKQPGDPNTTGHSWDGIEEFDNPMPRWWLWTFYATIVWAVIYTIMYPAWPLVQSATAGVLGWSSREIVQQEMVAFEEANAPWNAKLVETPLDDISKDPELQQYAVNAGGAVFRTWCAQCHGSGAQGAPGFPNLLDDAWLWGGTLDDIVTTVSYGIRSEESDDTRYSEMPAFGEILEHDEITQVVQYVMSLTNAQTDDAAAQAGKVVFEDNCASCHGEDGTGDVFQGAPNLTDAIWLYGGDEEALTETVTNSRFGVMPPWDTRLTEAQIRAVSAYVHQLGGGQ
ncbi:MULTISPECIES: cytochrome-c oxidase, cbb3-type subunit III [Alphaproteobacteria]|uniref:cytochrome-c oxidase, cbb3-type subunit III n=1 Tax=Alphaproteobacteria TaxID=28211 RepID=UPI0012BB679C|nr:MULTISPECIES: cytochrome-c oxidase, cbb3-type subunit III [Alphaproteobacteria]MTH98740.1 cytochrome-c oxidase, cbb3-type subunit III [Roseibium sp. RKSG952]